LSTLGCISWPARSCSTEWRQLTATPHLQFETGTDYGGYSTSEESDGVRL
jgi:hypothetical protein